MFNFDRQVRGGQGIVASEQQERSDEQKQRDVFEAHRHRVFSVSYYMTSNELEAEGILTETFIQVFQAPGEPDGSGVDQALLGELERRFSLAPADSAVPDQDIAIGRGQVRRTDLEEAVAVLPARERLVFLLRDVEGLSAQLKIAGLAAAVTKPEVNKSAASQRASACAMHLDVLRMPVQRSPVPVSKKPDWKASMHATSS